MFVRPALRFLVVAALASMPALRAAERPALTTAAAVLSLTAEQAGRKLPIEVTGIVTAAESDWNGQFFLQDETGGVFVENLHQRGPAPGDLVSVSGVSHPGAFAPIVSAPQWRKLGAAALPAPKQVLIENLEAGVEDGLRVEIAGVVRSVRADPARTTIDLAVGGFRLQVCAPPFAVGRPEALVAARIRVRGTTATHYNAALRHLTSVAVYVPRWEDIAVIEAESANPFAQPAVPLRDIAGYRRGEASGRLHVRGVVTLQQRGEGLFLQDATGGLRIQSTQPDPLTPGDPVEAVGFLEFEHHLPVLRDAVCRRLDGSPAPAVPRAVTFAELRQGLHHASVITLRGRIVDRTSRPLVRPVAAFSGLLTTWLLQGNDLAFTVEHEIAGDRDPLAGIPLGSLVELDGVCVSTVDTDGRLQSLKLLLPDATAMRVMARPSWLSPQRLLTGLGIVCTILVGALAWLLTISKKNAALQTLIREREQAQRELQDAHDTLEQKVAQRSAQLQVEMTARKTAELQFKAVLAERTRLARDLHDTLEQTLTGIALQLDATAKLFARAPHESQRHLQLARTWLHQSQVGLRRSIWDLRSRELEQFDLPRALQQSAEQLAAGTDLRLEFSTTGERRALPEVVEENVLRIGQEAFTNVAKHAHATQVATELAFAPDALRLRIADDGVGFAPDAVPPNGVPHFGLIGMTERAKRLGGRVVVDSAPGRGTVITVDVPLEPMDAAAAPIHLENEEDEP